MLILRYETDNNSGPHKPKESIQQLDLLAFRREVAYVYIEKYFLPRFQPSIFVLSRKHIDKHVTTDLRFDAISHWITIATER